MDYSYLGRPVTGDDEVPDDVEIDEVGVRMECLRLVLSHLKENFDHRVVLEACSDFAEFVINGTVPSKPN